MDPMILAHSTILRWVLNYSNGAIKTSAASFKKAASIMANGDHVLTVNENEVVGSAIGPETN